MLVRAKEHCYLDGFRRRPGAVFDFEVAEGKPLPRYLEPFDATAPVVRTEDEPLVIAGKVARRTRTMKEAEGIR